GAKIPVEFDRDWQPAEHRFTLEVHPLKEKPADAPLGQCSGLPTTVDLQIGTLDIQGPVQKQYWEKTRNFDRFFPSEEPPADPSARRTYERQVIAAFAKQAFRRPADDRVLDRLVAIWDSAASQPNKTFVDGAKEAMVAVLSSPRFVFRIEKPQAGATGPTPLLDEYSLASRLSYFLWSTMPDAELTALADKNQLRAHLGEQVKRMLKDPRSQELVSNFTGQWLELRDVDGININVFRVLMQDNQPLAKQAGPAQGDTQDVKSLRKQFAKGLTKDNPLFKLFGKNFTMGSDIRRALRAEPEMLFGEVMRNDESVATLLAADHSYLNEKLAILYNIPGIAGSEMRRVDLPKDGPRGGLITMGSVLIVTSNPTRTSPVKRGQFILDNILGMPTPPPPAEVPALEASEKSSARVSFRQVLEIHRSNAMCSSCHARMDPLGLSLENFNAMGMWREKELGLPIDATGKLMTGETFKDGRDVKRILKDKHLTDFYRCLAEKMMTYALGRGIEYYDTETVDQIVDRMQREDGRFSALLNGIVESAAFQRRRSVTDRIAGATDVPANPQTGRNPLN
ncbi:MAG TPA: DUF1592 domain-containing protein, partial [Tepidisphaeraceae bacterium]|nr:DUF1592 domain-containing protein [Tepidisphaeraceae bacterium]